MKERESEKAGFYFILNKGGGIDGKVTHAVLGDDIVVDPAGWDAYSFLSLAEEKLNSEGIQKRAKELGVELEIVALGEG